MIVTAADAARALEPVAGPAALTLFGIGLFGASMLGACILPLSTAYAISEAFGFERGVSRDFREAPVFFGLYTGLIVLGAGVVLLPVDPIKIILTSQLINGILLPIELIFILLLINDRSVMGRYVNGRLFNLIAWATAVILIALTGVLLITSVVGALPL